MTAPIELLIDSKILNKRVTELGLELTEAYAERTPILIMVLHGAVPFLADLARSVDLELEVDAIALTRFDSGGTVNLALSPSTPLQGRDVVIVEDIVDTGLTLRSIRAHLAAQRPASISTVALLNKATRRLVDVPVEFSGFTIGDEFVIGYGMDWEGQFRNLKDIWAVLDLEAFSAEVRSVPGQVWADSDRVGA
jgi:hypoxanthine phosphoribosyltransferase